MIGADGFPICGTLMEWIHFAIVIMDEKGKIIPDLPDYDYD